MKRCVPLVAAAVVISLLLVSTGFSFQEQYTPSAAVAKVQELLNAKRGKVEMKTYEQMVAVRAGIAQELLAQVKKDGLSREENLAYGDLLGLAQKNDEALKIYRELCSGTDKTAREADKNVISTLAGDMEKNAAQVEAAIADFHSRFKPDPEDIFDIYEPVITLARYYADKGDHEKAIAVDKTHLDWLTLDAPYYGYSFAGAPKDSFIALGRKDDAVKAINETIAKLNGVIAEREKNTPTAEEEKKAYERQTAGWKGLVGGLEANRTQIQLINAPAPDFTFTNFFNCDPFAFKEKTAGKVVLIDFWATWCGPCIATFPEMRKFYAEYAPKGVVVIGVTGFQGNMSNHGQDRVQNLSTEQELALMPEFIKFQNVTWPLALSDRNCYDPSYGIRGVPTAVIIDKKGNVRMFTHPYYQEKLRAMIDKLLAE